MFSVVSVCNSVCPQHEEGSHQTITQHALEHWNSPYMDMYYKFSRLHFHTSPYFTRHLYISYFHPAPCTFSRTPQFYTFRTERQTKSMCSISVQKGYTLGATLNLEFALPTPDNPPANPEVSLCLSVCLSLSLRSVYVCLSVCLSMSLRSVSACLSVCLSVCLSTCLSVYLQNSLYRLQTTLQLTLRSVSAYLSVCLSVCLSIYRIPSTDSRQHSS